MDDRVKNVINSKIDEVINNTDEITVITRTLKKLIDDEEQIAFGIALGRIYNAFHYQTRRILKRNATEDEFREFVDLLSSRTHEIKGMLQKHIRNKG